MTRYALDIIDRATKTAAQSALLVIGAEQVNALSADWQLVCGFALGGAALSVLTSLASGGIGRKGDASLLG